MALMMDSVRLQDELNILLEDLPADGTVLERNTEVLEWVDEKGKADAQELWGCLHSPLTVGQLFERSHTCHYHSARILARFIETEQVKPAVA